MRGRWRSGGSRTEFWRTALMAALVAGLLTSGVATVASALTMEIGPTVGDILVFRPGANLSADWTFNVATTSEPPRGCVLRPAFMAANGGSLVVEERSQERRVFRAHWAGSHTSTAAEDCGPNVELT